MTAAAVDAIRDCASPAFSNHDLTRPAKFSDEREVTLVKLVMNCHPKAPSISVMITRPTITLNF
jgi:hypothetical protein